MLIFLDIDGVMVPAASWKTPELLEDGFPMFTQKSIKSLNTLLSPETRIILSSSHRNRFSLEEWKGIFKRRGVEVRHLERLPLGQTLTRRKDEIQDWLASNTWPSEFLIIDDDKSLYDLPKELKDHLVMTSSLVGLTPEILQEAIGEKI